MYPGCSHKSNQLPFFDRSGPIGAQCGHMAKRARGTNDTEVKVRLPTVDKRAYAAEAKRVRLSLSGWLRMAAARQLAEASRPAVLKR